MADAVELTHLTVEPEGEATRPPLVIAHGLFGQARNFATLAKRLADGRRVVALDMRNHGDAPHADAMDYRAMAADLAAALRRHADGRAVVLGHSMGGKAAMALALTEPELVAGLIVADIAPVAYRHSHASYVAAMKSVDLGTLTRRSDAEPALEGAVGEPALRAFLLQSLEVRGGNARWKLNLDAIGAAMPDLLSFPDDLPRERFDGPTLFLRGGASDYAGPETHDAIRARFPSARIEALEGAGHWLHAERPEEFRVAVAGWLDATTGL